MRRIYFTIPIPFGAESGFWHRDSGLVVLELRKMGYDAWLVALGDDSTETEGKPILPVALQTLQDPTWWKKQGVDAVVLNTWSAPRYDAIRRAALAATPRVIERLDTDGIRSANLYPLSFYVRAWCAYQDTLPGYVRWLAPCLAAGRTAVFYALPALMDARMVKTMTVLPAAMAESPISAERMQHMVRKYSDAKFHVQTVAHPVNEDVIGYTGVAKENRIISVGRWAAAQKDYPKLRQVLRAFLTQHRDWQATVVGSGVPSRDQADSSSEEWLQRVTFHPKMDHEHLAHEYSRAKIYLMVSRFESFCIAAAEALCCGCSVVGSSSVPSSYSFAGNDSGRVSPTRKTADFLSTLDTEVASWNQGARDPKAIAAASRESMGSHAVARATLRILEEIPSAAIL